MDFFIEDKNLSKARFSSPFGGRIHPITGKPSGHRGIDIALPQRTPLIAPLGGTVHLNRTNGGGVHKGYGHYLVLKLDNGDYVLYGHLVERSKLQVGARVSKGQVVALSGNTGSSTGAHVHFEYHTKGFLFASQVKGNDTAINPIEVYPKLNGMQGKYLGSLVEKPKPTMVGYTNAQINIHYDKVGKPIITRGVRRNYSDGSFNQFLALRDLSILGFDVGYQSGKTTIAQSNNFAAPNTTMDYILNNMSPSKYVVEYQGKELEIEGLEAKDIHNNSTRFILISDLRLFGLSVEWDNKTQTLKLQ